MQDIKKEKKGKKSTTQKRYRLGIIGFGGMANWHRELLQDINRIEIAGVYDSKEEAMQNAVKHGLKTYRTADELLAEKDIDLVLIATPNDYHKPYAIAAMQAGKDVISEKPITLSSVDLKEMMEVSEQTGRFLTVHQNRRWDEDFVLVQKILEEGTLGNVFRIESRVHGAHGIPGDWRQEKEHGGGMVLDWGVHLLDQILLMMKDATLETVYATVTNVTNQLVDDGFSAELTFSTKQKENSRIVVYVEVGTSNFISLPRWYILGENGTAVVEDWERNGKIVHAVGADDKDVVPVRTAAGLTKTMAPRREDTISTLPLPNVTSDIKEFYQNVIEVLDGTAESRIKLAEAMRVMKLMEAIFISAEKKEVYHAKGSKKI